MVSKALALLFICGICGGCCSNTPAIIRALAKDPATTALSIQTVYGTVYVLRSVNTNQTVIVGPITVKP